MPSEQRMMNDVTSIAQGQSGRPVFEIISLKPGTKLTPPIKLPKLVTLGRLASADATVIASRSRCGTMTYRHAAFSDEQRRVDPDWIAEFALINREIQDASYRRPTRNPTEQELALAS